MVSSKIHIKKICLPSAPPPRSQFPIVLRVFAHLPHCTCNYVEGWGQTCLWSDTSAQCPVSEVNNHCSPGESRTPLQCPPLHRLRWGLPFSSLHCHPNSWISLFPAPDRSIFEIDVKSGEHECWVQTRVRHGCGWSHGIEAGLTLGINSRSPGFQELESVPASESPVSALACRWRCF